MMEKFEDTLGAMEENMVQRLSRIERRLDSLECVVSWEKSMDVIIYSNMVYSLNTVSVVLNEEFSHI